MRGTGQVVFALAVAALGLLSLGSGDFALNWQPVPKGIPGREILATLSGAMLFFGGLGLLFKPIARLAAMVLTVNFFFWLIVLQGPRVFAGWSHAGAWLGFGETSMLVIGAWAILASLQENGANSAHFARLLFGIGAPLIGLSHFVYLKETVDLVPAYLPQREFFAWFTGAAHIAAGFAVLLSVLPRRAASLEGLMMALFGLMVWAPKVAAHPDSRFLWTALLVSIAFGAAAQALADSYGKYPARPLIPRQAETQSV